MKYVTGRWLWLCWVTLLVVGVGILGTYILEPQILSAAYLKLHIHRLWVLLLAAVLFWAIGYSLKSTKNSKTLD